VEPLVIEPVEELRHRDLLAGGLTCGGGSEEALNAALDGGLNAVLNGRRNPAGLGPFSPERAGTTGDM
jgi:hypothetical protein